jgi:hypothetical protein
MGVFQDEVLACFPNVACYKYNKDERKWDRAGVCGPLLLYHRLDRPYFSLMVAKVDSLEVCAYPLTETVKMRFTAPHLRLFRPESRFFALCWCRHRRCSQLHGPLAFSSDNRSLAG